MKATLISLQPNRISYRVRCLEPRLENYERRRSSACSAASSLASHRSGNGGNGGGGVACIATVGEEQLGTAWQINLFQVYILPALGPELNSRNLFL